MAARRWCCLFPLVAGCVEYHQTRLGNVDIFELDPPKKVDVLLVVDDSSSMGSYQDRLGESFNDFISWFVKGNVDYHIAVTTTDDGNDPTIDAPARGRFVGPIITSKLDAASAADLFQREVRVGVDGSGVEVGLKGAWLALTDEALSEQSTAFLREDAALSVVFVSDEEDSSPWPVNDYLNAFFELKGSRDRDAFNASALTITDVATCAEPSAQYSSPGTRYVDLAVQTGGISADLCDADFAHIVGDLSLANSRTKDIFLLSEEPDAATFEVVEELDGTETELPCDDGAYRYQRVTSDGTESPAIVFSLDHLPPPGSTLSIHYLLGQGDVGAFCPGAP